MSTTFRGRPACICQVVWLPEFEAEAMRRGIIRGPLPISQLIGGAATSGNTHIGGGAADFYPLAPVIVDVAAFVELAREMGADATWERPRNWDGKDGVQHVHSVLTGCPHNGTARYQIAAVEAGFNGLGSGGQGAADDGPRPLSGRTWREGIAWAKTQQEDDMADPATKAQLDRIEAKLDQAAKRDQTRNQRVVKLLRKLRTQVKDAATVAEIEALLAEDD